MQTSLNESNSLASDKNPSSYPALYSQCYSESVERQTQNHFMAGFPLPPINGAQMPDSLALTGPDYLSNITQPRYVATTENQENFAKTVLSNQNPFECSSSAFETMNYCLPFDSSSRWDLPVQPPIGNSIMNEWIVRDFNSNNINPGSSHFSNELSLSLATSQNGIPSIQEQCSEMSSSSFSSLHKSYISSEHTSRSSDNLSLSCNSYKPIQLPQLSFGSGFFHAMQEILAEIARYALENFDQMSYYSNTGGGTNNGLKLPFSSDTVEVGAKMKHLLSLLQMVDDQYNRCLDEIHTVISAFHAVTELDPNLHARFALPTISLMYKNLRERISSHILEMGSNLSEREAKEENSLETSFFQKQWALQQLRKRDDHQLWRPQRGLPERSVSVLRAWMFQNFLHPYPKDAEKHLLALKSGLTRSQVSNWFINARVRLWKPMIEEMCTEMNARKTRKNDEETDGGVQRNYMRFEKRR